MNSKKSNSDYYSHMYSKKLIPIVILVVFSIYQCTSALYKPNNSDVLSSGTSKDTLIEGRKAYMTNCGSCHSLYLPERYSKAQWRLTMDSMQNRSKITDEQKKVILKYLDLKSKD